MTIKAKWDKFQIENSRFFTWIFIEGRMIVINDAAQNRGFNDNFNKKTFYEGTVIKKETERAK